MSLAYCGQPAQERRAPFFRVLERSIQERSTEGAEARSWDCDPAWLSSYILAPWPPSLPQPWCVGGALLCVLRTG